MKNLTKILTLLSIMFAVLISAQEKTSASLSGVKISAPIKINKAPKGGNQAKTFVSIPSEKHYNLDCKTEKSYLKDPVRLQNTATYQGKEYPVYIDKKGNYFIVYPQKDTTKGYSRKTINTEDY